MRKGRERHDFMPTQQVEDDDNDDYRNVCRCVCSLVLTSFNIACIITELLMQSLRCSSSLPVLERSLIYKLLFFTFVVAVRLARPGT